MIPRLTKYYRLPYKGLSPTEQKYVEELISRWAFGSVADKVLRSSCVPVVMVRECK